VTSAPSPNDEAWGLPVSSATKPSPNGRSAVLCPMVLFTVVHVLLSLAGIAAGFLVLGGLLKNREFGRSTAVFLAATLLTSVTGFFFPFHGFTPAIGLGIVSLIALAIAIYARYVRTLAEAWRRIYVISAVTALYFNVFVLVVQVFQKVPSLKALAPTQTEAPFAVTQLAVLALFVVSGIQAARKFGVTHSAAAAARASR
jgi:hypothetical protein